MLSYFIQLIDYLTVERVANVTNWKGFLTIHRRLLPFVHVILNLLLCNLLASVNLVEAYLNYFQINILLSLWFSFPFSNQSRYFLVPECHYISDSDMYVRVISFVKLVLLVEGCWLRPIQHIEQPLSCYNKYILSLLYRLGKSVGLFLKCVFLPQLQLQYST